MELNTDSAPDWLAPARRERWNATPGLPLVGEVWTVTWNSWTPLLVMIMKAYGNYVLVAPVDDSDASATEVRLPASELGVELTIWPQLETGMGLFMLHRNLGSAASTDEVLRTRRWAAGLADEPGLRPGSGPLDADRLAVLAELTADLCQIEWPNEVVLNVEECGLEPSEFQLLTGFDVSRVLRIWDGAPLRLEELSRILEALGRSDSEVLFIPPDPELTSQLSSPALKHLIVQIATARGLDEDKARNLAKDSYALAARTDSAARRQATRLVDTLMNLIRDNDASES